MWRIKAVAGGCLAALIASMAVSATAQALPEWQKEGKPLSEALPFKANGSAGQFQIGTVHLTWGSVGGKGSIKGTNELEKLSLIFWESKVAGCAVNSPGAKAGEVKTTELKGKIGYLDKMTKSVGVLAQPVSGTTVAEIEGSCLSGKVTITGSVIGRVSSALNTPVGSLEVSFAISGGVQEYTHFEGEATEHVLLAGGGLTGSALFECTKEQFELEGGKKVELKA